MVKKSNEKKKSGGSREKEMKNKIKRELMRMMTRSIWDTKKRRDEKKRKGEERQIENEVEA